MSTCLVTMVRDEADIIEPFIRHSVAQVDAIIVADNLSSDGTRDILDELAKDLPLEIVEDDDPAYYQSAKMTALAQLALQRGHSWVVPADCDEIWYVAANPSKRVADHLAEYPLGVGSIKAPLFDHIPTGRDDLNIDNPFIRIAWRKIKSISFPKVACRLDSNLIIAPGNHKAKFRGRPMHTEMGPAVRHFSWRNRRQFLHKIRVGNEAYALTDLSDDYGRHWRIFADASDTAIIEHFDTWFYSEQPSEDTSLIYDPAPVRC